MANRTEHLVVEGMSCASCVGRVSRGLGEVDGVAQADVNLATGRATVTFDPARVTPAALRGTIVDLGYGSPELVEGDDDGGRDPEERSLRLGLIGAIVLTVPVLLISMIGALKFDRWQWVVGALATPVVFWSGARFHRATLANLRHRAATMDTLVTLGTVAAWTWSAVALVFLGAGDAGGGMGSDRPDVYFETAAVIVTLILLGRYLELRARRASGDALRSLARLGARTARLEDGREVPAASIGVGDRFVVRPGETIATDGVVVEGASAVDRSLLTGESMPAEVTAGDIVAGGTLNTSGRLVVEANRVGTDTALARIVGLVEQAQASQAPVQRLADRISSVFVPAVLVVAVLTLVGWLVTGHAADDAFTAAVAVLIIACPCALGLATPTAIMVGTGRGAQRGIVFKGGEVLESTRRIDTVVLDKTGTVTEGRMALAEVVTSQGVDRDELLVAAASVEDASEHPIARAIADAVPADRRRPLVDFENRAGSGVRALVDGREVVVGRASLFAHVPDDVVAAAADQAQTGRTVVVAGWDGEAKGVLAVADQVKPTSADAVASLHALGLRVHLLTGDGRVTAEAVGRAVGVDEVRAEVLPDEKLAEVRRLQAAGRVVAMVGDGVNDAAALTAADLGIAVGTGTDVAIESSDVTLMAGDLRSVPDAIALARRTLRVIKGNLFWAFAYNLAAIPLAVLGVLNPMVAAGTMAFSSVFVVTNSLRLRRA